MKKTAFVLSGGGSRGAYEIGVWKALKELGVEIDMVFGTSVGAINGAMVAQDEPELAEKLWMQMETGMIFDIDTGGSPEQGSGADRPAGKRTEHTSDSRTGGITAASKKLYDLDYIFPKYRNFAAICSIYEYFVSGRCTELTGADGAYNLYESELRQNLIIERLDKIIDSLEVIKENQYALYSELERTNEILNGISSDMRELVSTVRRIEITANRIEDAVHITNYYTQVTAQNTKALKYIALING